MISTGSISTLYLNLRYAKLSKLWLNHGVPEEVTHSLEQSPGSWLSGEWIVIIDYLYTSFQV